MTLRSTLQPFRSPEDEGQEGKAASHSNLMTDAQEHAMNFSSTSFKR